MRLAAHVATELALLGERDQRVWAIDCDLGDSYGIEAIVDSTMRARFVQAGIAEQTAVSVAAGLAAVGKRPWVFSFAAFLCTRGYDQVRVSVSHTDLPVVLVGSHAGGCGGRNGKSHLALNDVCLMRSLPNMQVWAPADSRDVRFSMDQIINGNGPAYLRLPRDSCFDLPGESAEFRLFGLLAPLMIVSTGLATAWAIEAQAALMELEISVSVLHVLRLSPLPAELTAVLASAKQIIVIEDHGDVGGLADALRKLNLNCTVAGMSWPSHWIGMSGSTEDLRAAGGLSLANIIEHCQIKWRVVQSSAKDQNINHSPNGSELYA